jgi:hypothetical protein
MQSSCLPPGNSCAIRAEPIAVIQAAISMTYGVLFTTYRMLPDRFVCRGAEPECKFDKKG